MRTLYSAPWFFDILVDDFTGTHYIDVLGVGPGSFLRRVRLTRGEIAKLTKSPGLLEELAARISQDARPFLGRSVPV